MSKESQWPGLELQDQSDRQKHKTMVEQVCAIFGVKLKRKFLRSSARDSL